MRMGHQTRSLLLVMRECVKGGQVEYWEMKANQQRAVAGKTRGLDSGQKAGASTVDHRFRYCSVICLHIVSVFPQTDPMFWGWICRSELAPPSSMLI